MHSWLLRVHRVIVAAGFDPLRMMRFFRRLPSYIRDWRQFSRQAVTGVDEFPLAASYPCLGDFGVAGGIAKGHYFHQDLFVAQRIFAVQPRKHIDVGSRIDGFVAHVASFREIEVCDVRRTDAKVPNIRFRQLDLAGTLPCGLEGCCDSLSCLHAIEHIGLGRYGDSIDPQGHLKSLANLTRMLEPGGRLYLSTPIGPQRIEFNAHRVFSVQYILDQTAGEFDLLSLSWVDDQGDFHAGIPLTAEAIARNLDCYYGCGIFELRRLPAGGV